MQGRPVRLDTCRLQNGDADPLSEALKDFEEGGQLYICLAVFDARDVGLFRAYPGSELFLGQSGIEAFLFQTLGEDERFGVSVEGVASGGSWPTEIFCQGFFYICAPQHM